MSHDAHEIDAFVQKAYYVFGSLMVLTVLTVSVSTLDVAVGTAITIALIIALTKGTLVALFFMHLISEKGMIYIVLGFTVIFFFAVLLLPVLTGMDPITR